MMKKILDKFDLDGTYITSSENIRYFSGFTGSYGKLLITRDKKILFTDFRYKVMAKNQTENYGVEVVIVERPPMGTILHHLNKLKTIGFEDMRMNVAEYSELLKEVTGELKPLGDELVKVRSVKNEDEIEKIKKAVEIADEAFKLILPEIKVGVVEKEISAKLEYEMKRLGADKPSFEIIIASNERSSMPHGVASEKKLVNEGFVKIDFGCFYKGYASDMTRTVYLGENPSEKHLEIYNVVLEAQKKAIKAVRAGITVSELDKVARDHIVAHGYGENYGHGLGHGIGLEIHEYPGVSFRSNTVLEKNMVITIEPGIYIDGFGGVRIEDDVIVKENGCIALNKTSKEFRKV